MRHMPQGQSVVQTTREPDAIAFCSDVCDLPALDKARSADGKHRSTMRCEAPDALFPGNAFALIYGGISSISSADCLHRKSDPPLPLRLTISRAINRRRRDSLPTNVRLLAVYHGAMRYERPKRTGF